MKHPLFYEPNLDNDSIVLSEATAHHVLNVLRMKPEDIICLTDGNGTLMEVRIVDTSKKKIKVKPIQVLHISLAPTHFHLAIAFTKNPSRMEWLLEKITEIGVDSITPLMTRYSEKINFKRERWEKILISAMLQSKRLQLPILNDPLDLPEALGLYADSKLIAYCGEEFSKISIKEAIKPNLLTRVFIGPEGDFSKEEVQMALNEKAQVVHLGTSRLRTETAGLYACTAFSLLKET